MLNILQMTDIKDNKNLRFLHRPDLSESLELAASTTTMPNFSNQAEKYAQIALNCTPKFTIYTSGVKFYVQHNANCGQKKWSFSNYEITISGRKFR